MTACLVGRTALVELRPRKRVRGERPEGREVTVAFPAAWKRSTLLDYCRREHPTESVRIVSWHPVSPSGGGWDPSLWIANPLGFTNYKLGSLA